VSEYRSGGGGISAHSSHVDDHSCRAVSHSLSHRVDEGVCPVAGLLRRGMKPHEVTIPAVAKEARIFIATISRRENLFPLIRRANPNVQRRRAQQVYQALLSGYKRNRSRYERMLSLLRKKPRWQNVEHVVLGRKWSNSKRRSSTYNTRLLARCTCGVRSSHLIT
jgi:hypothetical protein